MRLMSDELKLLSQYVLLSAEERHKVLWDAIRDCKVGAPLVHAYRAVDEVI